jgi:hypothetical protein
VQFSHLQINQATVRSQTNKQISKRLSNINMDFMKISNTTVALETQNVSKHPANARDQETNMVDLGPNSLICGFSSPQMSAHFAAAVGLEEDFANVVCSWMLQFHAS